MNVVDAKQDVTVHGNRLFIQKKEDKNTSEGGIILPDASAITTELYTVVNSNVDLFTAGDEIVCQGMGPQKLPEEVFGEGFYYIEAEDVLATIRPSLKQLCEDEPLVEDPDNEVPDMDADCAAVTEADDRPETRGA